MPRGPVSDTTPSFPAPALLSSHPASLPPPASPWPPPVRVDARATPCLVLEWTHLGRDGTPSSRDAVAWVVPFAPRICPCCPPSPSEMRRAADALLRTLADASAAGMVGDLRVAEARPLLPGEDPARRVRWLAARPDGTVAAALTLTPRRAPASAPASPVGSPSARTR